MRIEIQEQSSSALMSYRTIAYSIIALFMFVAHLVFLDFISIAGITPNLLIILCVFIALFEGQFFAIFAGFFIGLLFDFFSGDIVGINAFTKMTTAFLAGFFYRENKIEQSIKSYNFLILVFFTSFVHNIIYFIFYIKGTDISFINFFLKYGLASSFYTTVISGFVPFIRLPRKPIVKQY